MVLLVSQRYTKLCALVLYNFCLTLTAIACTFFIIVGYLLLLLGSKYQDIELNKQCALNFSMNHRHFAHVGNVQLIFHVGPVTDWVRKYRKSFRLVVDILSYCPIQ